LNLKKKKLNLKSTLREREEIAISVSIMSTHIISKSSMELFYKTCIEPEERWFTNILSSVDKKELRRIIGCIPSGVIVREYIPPDEEIEINDDIPFNENYISLWGQERSHVKNTAIITVSDKVFQKLEHEWKTTDIQEIDW
jgi:hypothetical protein